MKLHVQFVSLALIASCVDAPDDVEVSSTDQEIQDGTLASSFYRARAAHLFNCTGTRIGPRHVLTALHCKKKPGDRVRFYTNTSANSDPDTDAFVESVVKPGCANVDATTGVDDRYDCDGNWADWAVLKLDREPPAGTPAVMAWEHPGWDKLVTKFGAGQHEGESNPDGELRMRSDYTYKEESPDVGAFTTNQYGGDGGDSGAGIFYGARLLGVTKGKHWDIVWRGHFTHVPFHLDKILEAMGYVWEGTWTSDYYRVGTVIDTFLDRSARECMYICDHTPACEAVNWNKSTHSCRLVNEVTSATVNPAFVTGRKL